MNITADHWIEGVARDPITANQPMLIRRCVVEHFTGGASGKSSITAMRERGVSAHVVIERDGTIIQCVPFHRKAMHAGKSRWRDPKTGILYNNANDYSIGIEIANAGDDDAVRKRWSTLPPLKAIHRNGGPQSFWESYPEAQIAAVIALTKALVERYNLDDVTGHDCIAPERKNDPGPAFPMQRVREACGFTGLPVVHKA